MSHETTLAIKSESTGVYDDFRRMLPLRKWTNATWVPQAFSQLNVLLNDHAQLERKAAANALALVHRWPEQIKSDTQAIEHWTSELTDIARDEVAHLDLVLGLLKTYGGKLEKYHSSEYASRLREATRRGSDPNDLVDRLLVSALIEARSCERFYLLAEHCEDKKLSKVYRGLWSSEHGHYKVFVELAGYVVEPEVVEKRFNELLEYEAEVIQSQPEGALLHSWVRNLG